jgi:hypothetical protein
MRRLLVLLLASLTLCVAGPVPAGAQDPTAPLPGTTTATTPAPGAATATATTATATTPAATTPQPTAPQPTPQTTTTAAGATADDDGGTPGAAVLLIVLTGLLLLLLAVWGAMRWWAWEPSWLLRSRHASAEAGWRVSAAWAEFTDWLRLGR